MREGQDRDPEALVSPSRSRRRRGRRRRGRGLRRHRRDRRGSAAQVPQGGDRLAGGREAVVRALLETAGDDPTQAVGEVRAATPRAPAARRAGWPRRARPRSGPGTGAAPSPSRREGRRARRCRSGGRAAGPTPARGTCRAPSPSRRPRGSGGRWASAESEESVGSGAVILARPKSRTLTRPSVVTMTFAGLRSRWTMPFSWAAARASARAVAISRIWASGEPALGDHAVEGLALDELHGEEVDAVRLLDRVDGDDAGVVEGGEGLGLALEALEPLRVGGHLGRQHLEGHVAPELRVGRAVHLAHPAGADRGGDAVVGERCDRSGRASPSGGSSSLASRALKRGSARSGSKRGETGEVQERLVLGFRLLEPCEGGVRVAERGEHPGLRHERAGRRGLRTQLLEGAPRLAAPPRRCQGPPEQAEKERRPVRSAPRPASASPTPSSNRPSATSAMHDPQSASVFSGSKARACSKKPWASSRTTREQQANAGGRVRQGRERVGLACAREHRLSFVVGAPEAEDLAERHQRPDVVRLQLQRAAKGRLRVAPAPLDEGREALDGQRVGRFALQVLRPLERVPRLRGGGPCRHRAVQGRQHRAFGEAHPRRRVRRVEADGLLERPHRAVVVLLRVPKVTALQVAAVGLEVGGLRPRAARRGAPARAGPSRPRRRPRRSRPGRRRRPRPRGRTAPTRGGSRWPRR